ncbi:variant surface glycoprotein (VSG)-related,putative [Trypanosoma brucei gambiense DAL972]|uniref:Variant surface glycoprotein (VSG)-related,putative n=1 Tax=Trypanosoma brucei gambiense (strain MHOM/CI/86/DAL972) TaxID=679716 RepID=C9ZK19_TRYB9|nr:variant surface glycoprotein (VSG)-related,putative [Trypanosoma brucei gambiense DAL972]CBH09783.1 variant surface glycoprotein (VSG)-related,putative [Trypanosoma brucei gambiense DAL972]|eukprot:XP_011772076.1 variant surface glycoprotein (VSG)-related,putative [Trypanosoma brucei gambiense DAL972]
MRIYFSFIVVLLTGTVENSKAGKKDSQILNENEFKTLCGFVNLTFEIQKLASEGKPTLGGLKPESVNESVNTILYGNKGSTEIGFEGENDRKDYCGDRQNRAHKYAGKSLIKDILCLCKPHKKPGKDGAGAEDLCFSGNKWYKGGEVWSNKEQAKQHWEKIRLHCNQLPKREQHIQNQLYHLKEKVQAVLRTATEKKGRESDQNIRLGGHQATEVKQCSATTGKGNSVCLMYNITSGTLTNHSIPWLKHLEELAEKIPNDTRTNLGTSENDVETVPNGVGDAAPSTDRKINEGIHTNDDNNNNNDNDNDNINYKHNDGNNTEYNLEDPLINESGTNTSAEPQTRPLWSVNGNPNPLKILLLLLLNLKYMHINIKTIIFMMRYVVFFLIPSEKLIKCFCFNMCFPLDGIKYNGGCARCNVNIFSFRCGGRYLHILT